MASEQIIQLSNLLQPISAEYPAGNDIRKDSSPTSLYYTVKDARGAARAAERSNMFDGNSTESDEQWRKIIELAPDILQHHAKDLEVASWFTEALIRLYGFQGLRDGFKLIHGLLEQYWENLFPLPDEDGIETRVAALTGLNGEGAEGVLIAPVRNVALTQGSDPGAFSYWKYQQALEIDKIIDDEIKTDKVAKLGFSLQDIEQAVSESTGSFYLNITDDIREAIDTFREASRLLDEYCGISESPPSSNILNILEDCLGAINHIAKHKIPSEHEMMENQTENELPENQQTDREKNQLTTGLVNNRQDAFKKLTEISDFFRKTEPHSPISYILERAIKWGDMPLEELMKELIPDSSARDVYGSLTGVKTEDNY